MNPKNTWELKRRFLQKLKEAGYVTIPELVQILPPTIMNIIGSSINTAENLFAVALKSHMKSIALVFQGKPPEGINKALTEAGFLTLNQIAEANPVEIAKALHISLEKAGDIVLYAMELAVEKETMPERQNFELIQDLDKEISHYLGQLERLENQKVNVAVEETLKKIQERIKLPTQDFVLLSEQKNEIVSTSSQFMTVFPSCTGFALYNKRATGIISHATDNNAKETLAKIHDSLPSLFWKISLILENRNEYGWLNAGSHLIWIEAIRNRNQKQQLAYIAIFIFEKEAKEGIGTATPTIKGIAKEIERIIYSWTS